MFTTELNFPTDYPLSPPQMKFISEMFHPNGECPLDVYVLNQLFCVFAVYPDGRVCISILHTPGEDPLGYEKSSERWSPVQSIEKILLSVVSMLAGTCVYCVPVVYMYVCVCIFVCACVCGVCVCICMCVFACVCVFVCVCVCAYCVLYVCALFACVCTYLYV